jgi:2,4-didehydro-3-deoxy-L-rhamnonate hydrolase
VMPDELADPDYLVIGCAVDGEKVPDACTRNLYLQRPRIVAELCAVLPLGPRRCDLHQHPACIGATGQPPRFLQPCQVLESWIEGIGTISNRGR